MLFGRVPIRVQPFFGFRNSERLILSARALRAREPVFEPRSLVGKMRTMLSQYASHEEAGIDVALEYRTACGGAVKQVARTGPEGFAHFDLEFGSSVSLPSRTQWETAQLRWASETSGGKQLEASARILAPGSNAGLGVVSDIDDTILETGITGNVGAILRNWRRILVEMPGERIAVSGAAQFYAALGGATEIGDAQPRALIRPVFYVSSSPWNLFSYLVAFKQKQGFPLGPIMLRDWGFNRKTLGSEGHGSHKRNAIERILREVPHLRFVLVGDDTQKDLVAFADVVHAHPDRIAAVFIRSASLKTLDRAERSARAAIERAGVPFWTGADYTEAGAFLEQAGLDLDRGIDEGVRAASDGR